MTDRQALLGDLRQLERDGHARLGTTRTSGTADYWAGYIGGLRAAERAITAHLPAQGQSE